MVCTIAKRSAKRLKFLNPDPFTKRESAVSNFHTNLMSDVSVAVGRTAVNTVKVLMRQRTLDNMNVR